MRDKYGLGKLRDMIRNQATLFRDFLKDEAIEQFSDPLDLKLGSIPKETTSRRLGLAYEAGNIISKLYLRENVPDELTLAADIKSLIDIYFSLFQKIELEENKQASDEKEDGFFEDLTKYRTHKIVERNISLSALLDLWCKMYLLIRKLAQKQWTFI